MSDEEKIDKGRRWFVMSAGALPVLGPTLTASIPARALSAKAALGVLQAGLGDLQRAQALIAAVGSDHLSAGAQGLFKPQTAAKVNSMLENAAKSLADVEQNFGGNPKQLFDLALQSGNDGLTPGGRSLIQRVLGDAFQAPQNGNQVMTALRNIDQQMAGVQ